MIRLALLTLPLCLAACGQREQPSVGVTPTVALEPPALTPTSAVPVTPAASKPQATPSRAASPPAEPPPSPGFEYPSDLAGKAVVKAVSPAIPAPRPVEKFGASPWPRTPPAKVLNPEPTVTAFYTPPPLLPPPAPTLGLSPPRETVPVDLGRGADLLPARPSLPVAAGSVERARDVALPPAMPTLGRPHTDRVSLEDPTSEFANAAIVEPAVKVPLASADFLKVSLPDPFELGEQVKPKLPPAAEPGLSPVTVNPQRVK